MKVLDLPIELFDRIIDMLVRDVRFKALYYRAVCSKYIRRLSIASKMQLMRVVAITSSSQSSAIWLLSRILESFLATNTAEFFFDHYASNIVAERLRLKHKSNEWLVGFPKVLVGELVLRKQLSDEASRNDLLTPHSVCTKHLRHAQSVQAIANSRAKL